MTSEKDEFFYHENLVHLAALTHPQPARALIVGGGDGGSAEELLKHPSIKSVTLCRDRPGASSTSRASICSASTAARSTIRGSTLQDRGRLRVRAQLRPSSYDLIVLDLTDSGGPSLALYTPEFYRACAARLDADAAR